MTLRTPFSWTLWALPPALLPAALLCLSLLSAGCASEIDIVGGSNPSEPQAYLLQDYPRLTLEVDAVPGAEPRAGVSARLIEAIGPVLNKPGGITVVMDGALESRGADHVWTFAEVDALARESFDADVSEGTAVMHVMWLDGSYQADGVVLGIAWENRYIAMFSDAIANACERPLIGERLCLEAEAAVWTHEVGHVLGLVNNGIPMVEEHEDADHPGHTSDRDGVMYFAYESASAIDLLAARLDDSSTFAFGPASLADVAAFQAAE